MIETGACEVKRFAKQQLARIYRRYVAARLTVEREEATRP